MKQYALFLAAAAGVTTVFSPLVMAQPTVSKSVEYYDVKGWDAAFIHNEMDAKGPNDRNSGKRVWAHTRWRVNWKFSYDEQSISCRITKIDTDVRLSFVVPKWVERNKAPESVQKKWDAFYAALQKHEFNHAQHGIKAAQEIEALVGSLGKKRLCSQAKDEASEKARVIIDKYGQMDVEYDDKTDHGKTEGVTF